MEHNLKILLGEYIDNHVLDYIRIVKLSLDDQTMFNKYFKQRRPPMKDNLRCKDDLKVLWG